MGAEADPLPGGPVRVGAELVPLPAVPALVPEAPPEVPVQAGAEAYPLPEVPTQVGATLDVQPGAFQKLWPESIGTTLLDKQAQSGGSVGLG